MQRIGWAVAIWMFVLVGWGLAARAQQAPQPTTKELAKQIAQKIFNEIKADRAKNEIDSCVAWFDRCFIDEKVGNFSWAVTLGDNNDPWRKTAGGTGNTWCTLLPAGRIDQVAGFMEAWFNTDSGIITRMKRRSDAQVDESARCYPPQKEGESADSRNGATSPDGGRTRTGARAL